MSLSPAPSIQWRYRPDKVNPKKVIYVLHNITFARNLSLW